MKIQAGRFGLLLLCLVACTAAQAAQRVLINFSESGFAVIQVRSVPGIDHKRTVDGTGQAPGITSVADAIELLKPGQGMLIWQNERLEWLHVSTVDDPRIVQSPMHVTSVIDTRAGLSRGAWIADGPDGAERVVLLLAENQSLGLQLEQWPLWLHEQ